MVRLKAWPPTGCCSSPQFQFHYGTIKSWHSGRQESHSENFNSTMVRLKVVAGQSLHSLNEFQFHYGTIKRESLKRENASLKHFNSTMVRLKELSAIFRFIKTLLFQFHYGTIKSCRRNGYRKRSVKFQFHYGTIKSLTLEKISALIFKNLANTKL